MEFLAQFHPKVVHFPIALFTVYAFLEIVGTILKKEIFTKSAYIILILGVAGAVAAVLTGREAEEAFDNWNKQSGALMEEHEFWATLTLWYFVGVLLLRTIFVIMMQIRKKYQNFTTAAKYAFVVLALIGSYFIFQTGEYGGQMVYKHGVGTEPINNLFED